MKDFLSILRSSQLFSGISENELTSMLSCLDTRKEDFPKKAFVLRAGDTVDSIGIVLSGSVLIIQEDIGETGISFQKPDRDRPLLPSMPALQVPD